MPNYDQAAIPRRKLEDYVLNPFHAEGKHKARVFAQALGFVRSDWQELANRIKNALPYSEARPGTTGPWGTKYETILLISGLNGHEANMLAIWIFRTGKDYPSLVTAYVAN